MERIINTLYKRACRKGLEELAQLGSGVAASARGCAGLLEASQRPDEPVEAINGRFEHLRRNRPGVVQPRALHRAVLDSLRAAAHSDQCTPKHEELVNSGLANAQHFRHFHHRVRLRTRL
ncbi:hypothetical protein HMPREF1292_01170 [Corynebacterium sp. KPL1995]|nr:hypothetical protein HMPREF1292_01170 [Corynebacterium sp. KPL1995]ERS73177.1 hypothetical protein HMPREF1290_01174 [Corynebacterium sp. KPL1989]